MLSIHVLAGQNLSVRGKAPDAYCKVKLKDAEKKTLDRRRTPVIKGESEPQWNAVFKDWNLVRIAVKFRSVYVEVWDRKMTKDEFLGYIDVPLTAIHGTELQAWMPLQPLPGSSKKAFGGICVKMIYKSTDFLVSEARRRSLLPDEVAEQVRRAEMEQSLYKNTGRRESFAKLIDIGDKVALLTKNGTQVGQVRFKGLTSFHKGLWIGVELDAPLGKNDGSVDGIRYFSCPDLHGLFSQPQNVAEVIHKAQRVGGPNGEHIHHTQHTNSSGGGGGDRNEMENGHGGGGADRDSVDFTATYDHDFDAQSILYRADSHLRRDSNLSVVMHDSDEEEGKVGEGRRGSYRYDHNLVGHVRGDGSGDGRVFSREVVDIDDDNNNNNNNDSISQYPSSSSSSSSSSPGGSSPTASLPPLTNQLAPLLLNEQWSQVSIEELLKRFGKGGQESVQILQEKGVSTVGDLLLLTETDIRELNLPNLVVRRILIEFLNGKKQLEDRTGVNFIAQVGSGPVSK